MSFKVQSIMVEDESDPTGRTDTPNRLYRLWFHLDGNRTWYVWDGAWNNVPEAKALELETRLKKETGYPAEL
jgi:hypothetical protein